MDLQAGLGKTALMEVDNETRLIVSTLLLAGAVPALAADLPVKAPPPILADATGPASILRQRRLQLGPVEPVARLRHHERRVHTGGLDHGGGTDLEGGRSAAGSATTANFSWVWGFETDIQWANQRSNHVPLPATVGECRPA